jgi:hypothetical protein
MKPYYEKIFTGIYKEGGKTYLLITTKEDKWNNNEIEPSSKNSFDWNYFSKCSLLGFAKNMYSDVYKGIDFIKLITNNESLIDFKTLQIL